MNSLPSRSRFLSAAGALALPAAVPLSIAAAPAFTMRLATSASATSAAGNAAIQFASAVERRSNGQVRVEVYPNGQLAKEQESIDNLVTGVIDLAIITSPFLSSLFPRFDVISAPFLFANGASAYRLLDGPIGNELFAEIEQKDLVGLCWGGGSFKEIETTSKAVVVPDDLKGLRIRCQAGAVYAATYQALGAIPLTIDVNEAYVALTQHTIDGLDILLDGFVAGKFYTIVKHIAMSNHIFSLFPMIASKRKLSAMPAPLQKIIKDEGKALAGPWRIANDRQIAAGIDMLKKNGVTFTEIQAPAFQRAMDPIYTMLQGRIGADFMDRVRRTVRA